MFHLESNSHSLPRETILSQNETLDCAYRILDLIKRGVIDRHQRLGEGSLVSYLKMPRSTIRAALDHLEASGLVIRVPRSGTFFREVSVKELCDGMDVRATLEGLAARLATLRCTDSDLAVLREKATTVDNLNSRFITGDQEVIPELMELDRDFHLSLARLSDNRRLVITIEQQRIIEQSYLMGLGNIGSVFRPRRDRPLPTHCEIVEALATHDPQKADEVIRMHILRTKELRLGAYTGEMM